MRRIPHFRLLAASLLLLVLAAQSLGASLAAAGDESPAPDEIARAKALERGQAKLAKSLAKTTGKVWEAADGRVVALLRTKPALESDLEASANVVLDRLLQRTLLRAGILADDVESQAPLPSVYKHGKLALGSRVDRTWTKRLRDEGAVFSLEARWALADGRFDVSLRLRDLASNRTRAKWSLTRIDTRIVPLEELAAIEPLPDANLAILLFAIRMLGKRVDRGECWDVPAHPLKNRGFTPKGYTFGRPVPFEQALPGDVVTIDARGHHHVMVLWRKRDSLDASSILHQNWSNRRHVMVMGYPGKMVKDSIIWRPGP